MGPRGRRGASPHESMGAASAARSSSTRRFAIIFASVLTAAALTQSSLAADQEESVRFFETSIRPLLIEHCHKCHGPQGEAKGGLRLTSHAALLRGGESGPSILVGNPKESLLIQAVRYESLKMPPDKKLSADSITKLSQWIAEGAIWPADPTPVKVDEAVPSMTFTPEQRSFWSFQPIKSTPPPAVRDQRWPRQEFDRFILARLERQGLTPAPEADKRTWLRRVTHDLIGLPPSVEELEAFLADASPQAKEKVVDRLLASPHYGERWARHWLDVVRYTDCFDARLLNDGGKHMDCFEAYRYRDWVVDALNRDLPYDAFVRAQIAGDINPQTDGSSSFDPQGIIPTTMLAIGNWGGGDADKEKLLTDIVDDQIDVVTRGLMGLTVSCARCHHHKFDPISTEDYYGLAGIFFSTHILKDVGPKTNGPPMLVIPLISPGEFQARAQAKNDVERLNKEKSELARRAREQRVRDEAPRTVEYLSALEAWLTEPTRDLARFATARRVNPASLARWLDLLGLSPGQPLERPRRDVGGKPGIIAHESPAGLPSVTVNPTQRGIELTTVSLAARSIIAHPGPASSVAIEWVSPIKGSVTLSIRLKDADAHGGDGVGWWIEQARGPRGTLLAAGELANGGERELTPSGGGSWLPIGVEVGDVIRLVISPNREFTCDSTRVDWVIRDSVHSASSWNVASDLLADADAHSIRPGRAGNQGVWRLVEIKRTSSPGAATLAGGGPLLEEWREAFLKLPSVDSTAAQRARDKIERALKTDPATSVDGLAATLKKFLESAESPYYPSPGEPEPVPDGERAEQIAAQLKKSQAILDQPIAYCNGAQEGGVPDSPQAGFHDVRVHIRGRYDRLGPVVPRRFPTIIAGSNPPPITSGSGRRELAQWITRDDHPLTSRVIVNRLWQLHFGAGLVRTPGNFGKLGQPPTHPELLDYLADLFKHEGWSLKRMHRRLVLSSTYGQSTISPESVAKDPDNKLWGRMNRRRLEAEGLRDHLLSAAGMLDRRMGGPAVRDLAEPRRTLYIMTIRSDQANFRSLFDAADSTAIAHERTESTVAPQALFLLNHPLVKKVSENVAKRVLADANADPSAVVASSTKGLPPKTSKSPGGADIEAMIDRLCVRLFARGATPEEKEIGRALLSMAEDPEKGWRDYAHALLCSNEFLYLD